MSALDGPMKPYNRLYEEICSFENLLWAARRAERCKRFQDVIGRFRTELEAELLRLRQELLRKSYQPGGYREKVITRPKRRMISAAPFRDRVVHHAVCNVVMPLFERKMVFDLYSNREGKGTHAAIERCQEFCWRFRFVLKCDVRKFFPSMDHAVLKFLGQRVWPWRRRLCRQNVADARRRLRWNVREYQGGRLGKDALVCRWNSWRGHALQAEGADLVERVRTELRDALGAAGT